MNALRIEILVSSFFGYRQNIIVPNVWWGLGFSHECDLLVVSKSKYATEIEIKTSVKDLKRDLKKRHNHSSNIIRKLFFALPEHCIRTEFIPVHAGIISIWKENYMGEEFCKIIRPAKINKLARPLSDEQMIHLGKLAAMRIWTLKSTLYNKYFNERKKVD